MGFLSNVLSAIGKNSPMLMTAGALVTGAATVYFAVKGAEKARTDIQTEMAIKAAIVKQQLPEDKKDQPIVVVLTKKEKAKIIFKRIWLAILCGAASTTLMFGGQIAAGRKIKAAQAAADIAERSLQDYIVGSVKTMGQKKAAEAMDEAVAERAKQQAPPCDRDGKVIAYGKGDTLCYDAVMDTWFYSSIDKINRAVNECNARILEGEFVLINDFYDEIGDGIKHPRDGGQLGFGVGLDELAKHSFIRVSFDSGINEDNEVHLIINYTCKHRDTYAPYVRQEVGEVE